MPKKDIILLVVMGILVITFSVLAATYIWNKQQPVAEEQVITISHDGSEKIEKPDLSLNLGACSLIAEADIKQSLGGAASSLQSGYNLGVAKDALGQGQACFYAFSKPGSLDNGFRIEVYKFSDAEDYQTELGLIRDSEGYVSDFGQGAVKGAVQGDEIPHSEFFLSIYNNQTKYDLRITQIKGQDQFSEDIAHTALASLAGKIAL